LCVSSTGETVLRSIILATSVVVFDMSSLGNVISSQDVPQRDVGIVEVGIFKVSLELAYLGPLRFNFLEMFIAWIDALIGEDVLHCNTQRCSLNCSTDRIWSFMYRVEYVDRNEIVPDGTISRVCDLRNIFKVCVKF